MQRLRQQSRLVIVCVGVLALFVLPSCGTPTTTAESTSVDQANPMPDGGGPGSAGPPSAASSRLAPPAVVVPGPAEPDNPGGDVPALPAWVPVGPADPADPPPDGWYSPLVEKSCENMPGDDPLVNAARAMCIALTGGTPQAWEDAATLFLAVPAPEASNCIENTTYQVLHNVLDYRQKHPDGVVETTPGEGVACPLGLTGVAVPPGDDPTAEVPPAVSPGAQVRLLGRFLDVGQVLLNGQPVPVARNAENNFTFIVPEGLQDGAVQVLALASGGAGITGSASFEFLAAQPSSGSQGVRHGGN